MDLRAPVAGRGFSGFREPVHGSHRGEAELTDITAQEQACFDLHQYRLVAPHVEAIRAGDAGAVQGGINGHFIRVVRGRHEVKAREVGKLFRVAGGGYVDRDTTGGQTVLVELPDGAEVRGAKESSPVIRAPVGLLLAAAFLDSKARKARAFGQLARGAVRWHGEVGRIVKDLAGGKTATGRGALDRGQHVHVHGCWKEVPELKERNRKPAGAVAEQ